MSAQRRRRSGRRTPEEELMDRCRGKLDDIYTLTPQEVGRLGEILAGAYLEERGFKIQERNYRCSEGEADLVALDESSDEVVLVEVKTRRALHDEPEMFPELAVDARKQKRYERIAGRYLMQHFPVMAIRFDIVAVTLRRGSRADIEHLVGAFQWDSER